MKAMDSWLSIHSLFVGATYLYSFPGVLSPVRDTIEASRTGLKLNQTMGFESVLGCQIPQSLRHP